MSRTHHHRRRPRQPSALPGLRVRRVEYCWDLPRVPWPECKAFDARLRRVLDSLRHMTIIEGRSSLSIAGPPGAHLRAAKAKLRAILGPTVDEQRTR